MNAPTSNHEAPPPHLAQFARLLDHIRGGCRRPLQDETEIPVSFYTDPHWAERERRELFRRFPIIVGHSAMLRRPGDHFTHDALGAPILVARGRDGEIRAFYNVCRHRGVRLVEADDGVMRRPSFVCPYHHWTYGLDGSLMNVPLRDEVFPGVDLSCRSLKAIPCAVRHGFIWVQLEGAEGAPDMDRHLDTLDYDFAAFGAAEGHVYRRASAVKKANWKLIVDAFQDGYHIVRLHQKTVGPFFIDGAALLERAGLNLRAAIARKEIEEVLDAGPESWRPRHHVSYAHFVFPNTIMIFHPDYISQLGLFPLGPDETRVEHLCLIDKAPETEKEEAHWRRAFAMVEDGVFHAEDYFVCESTQKGLHSGANETHLIGAQEYGVAMFRQCVREVMGPLPGDP